MAKIKAVDLLLRKHLPETAYLEGGDWDVKGIEAALLAIAKTDPERYAETANTISRLGREASYFQGETIGLDDADTDADVAGIIADMEAEIDSAKKSLKGEAFEKARTAIWHKYTDLMEKEIMRSARSRMTTLAASVASGARGKPPQLRAMIATPGIYEDASGNIIPLYVRYAYADGVRPSDYLAGSYGSRKSITSTKRATAQGGDILKIANQSAAAMVVTQNDCGTDAGLSVDPLSHQARGRVLALPAAGFPAGTVIDRKVAKELSKSGAPVVVRSPISCAAEEGVCVKCMGVRHNGKFAKIGDHVGAIAANAMFEPLTQLSLNCLAEGTLVRMADNSIRLIENINIGDMVLGADIKGNTFPVRVLDVIPQGYQPVFEYKFRSGCEILKLYCTKEHKILAKSKSGNIRVKIGTPECATVVVANSIVAVAEKISEKPVNEMFCWDLSVDYKDELFVLANGLIVKNSKHQSGMSTAKQNFSGMKFIQSFVQVPDQFPGEAPVASTEGVVESVKKAPQGGNYVTVNSEQYYVPEGFEILVKPGDRVNAGQKLSNGLVNPMKIVELRGIGEGRRYYAKRLAEILKDTGIPSDPIHAEVLARSAINHVLIEDPDDPDYTPGAAANFNKLQAKYAPPEDAKAVKLEDADGMFIQKPVLHFTVGAKVDSRVKKKLAEAGINEVIVSPKSPAWKPIMPRLRESSHDGSDWLAKLSTSYVKRNLGHSAELGEETNVAENVHYAPRLAIGEGFGDKVRLTGKF